MCEGYLTRAEKEEAAKGAAFVFSTGRVRTCSELDRGKLLRPAAIVPNVGTICPRNRLAPGASGDALQHVIWNFGTKNYFVALDAIGNVPLHGTIPCVYGANLIISTNLNPDESKGQAPNNGYLGPLMEVPSGMRSSNGFFTIGHGTRPIAGFVDLLIGSEVRLVVDVRTAPRSRTNPQFDRETIATSLATFGIEYRHIAELGGLRPRQRQVPISTNAFWQNQSFHNYADYAMGLGFQSALQELCKLGDAKRCAIMCAETLWWRCHRRIIADYLVAAGELVFHILGPGQVEEAHLTPAAKRSSDGVLVYPAQ